MLDNFESPEFLLSMAESQNGTNCYIVSLYLLAVSLHILPQVCKLLYDGTVKHGAINVYKGFFLEMG